MADPFSIVAGTAGLADVCVRLARFIKQANAGFRTVDQELQNLFQETESLRSINDLVKRSYIDGFHAKSDCDQQHILDTHWRATQNTLTSCQRIVEQIEALLKEITDAGSGKHVRLDQLRKWLKQQSKEEVFNTLREKLKAHQIALQLSLSAVSMSFSLNLMMTPLTDKPHIYSRSSHQKSHQSYTELSRSIQGLGADVESKINSLERVIGLSAERTLESAVASAQEVVPLEYPNRHFFTPQSVSSIFTGRESELEVLRKHVASAFPTDSHQAQRRFVIFGLAGSGKTQLCCKFASDNKQSFWGVFWINASSKEHAEQSFSTISTIGKVAPNRAAVKSWLSSLGPEQPWLLIVDNADEKDFPVEEYFPDNNVGTILITTRNPMLKTRGTAGPRYFEFHGLEEQKAIELLLTAADEPVPRTPSSVDLARDIARTLGYLPLALVHAGKTILGRLCTLETYLDFFEKSWARIRQMKEPNAVSAVSDTNAAIYSSFELIHHSITTKKTQAAEDALDLLRVFSFLDRQRIKLNIFIRAARNPGLESSDEIRKQSERNAYGESKPQSTRAQMLRNVVVQLVGLLSQLGHRPVVPRLFADASIPGAFDELRLREALNELSRMSLISTSSESSDCYSMHAAVHLWARQRPEMTLVEQAIWCQMTATILSRAILLPPLGDTEDDEFFRRDLLPHVRHVQQVERKIQICYEKNRESRRKFLPMLKPPVTSDRLLQLIKFSLVYAQGFQLEEAEKLQSYVADIAIRYLGMENMKTINITRLLSWTYWQLARVDDAVALQKRALDACIKVLGRDNPETLQIMDSYGSSLWLQGRIPEARKVHAAAVEGLQKTLGNDHIQTLKAMGGLGRTVSRDFDFTQAISIHSTAYASLKTQLGSSHSATLEAMDNLAMAHFERAAYRKGQPGDLDRALELESEVFTKRVDSLGREHYHTLWSGLNLGRIRAIRGEIDEALLAFLPGHAVVRRDLGETHFIYLFGELHHGRIMMCAGRYEEAERILSNVVELHKEKRNRHPDRLLAMFSLIKCRNVLGKEDQTTSLFEELTEGTKALFGPDHAAMKYLVNGQTLSKDTSDVLSPCKPKCNDLVIEKTADILESTSI